MRKKKVFGFVIVLCFILLLSTNALALNNNFEINSYDIKMNVREDNSYEIKETIDVQFNIDRHGIIRNIPLITNTGQRAKITKVNVQNHQYKKVTESGDYKIKIGDPNQFANANERYEISYVYHMGNDGVEGMDELYFNLIGLEWDVYIRNVTFEITMPKDFDASKLNFTYGAAGSTQNTDVAYTIQGNTITGRLKRQLGPNEALTVALPLEDGYFLVKEPVLGTFISNNYELVYLIAVLIAILLWGLFGKNRIIFPTVEFYAPSGLTPADVGYIYDGVVNPYDITSLIIYWADKGYIEIEEQENKGLFGRRKKPTLILHKIKELNTNAREYEQKMFNNLFNIYGNGKSVSINDLKNKFYRTIEIVKNGIQSIWMKDKKNRAYTMSGKFFVQFIHLLSFVTATAVGYGIVYNSEPGFFDEIIVFAVIIGIIIAFPVRKISGLIVKWKYMLPRDRIKPTFMYGLILIVIAGGGMLNLPDNIRFMIITGYIACFTISILAENSNRRTKTGDQYMEKILGFKDFILHAEKDRINMMVNDNPQYFFNVLPYAMVLGITDKWARKFESITIESPNWYNSNTDRRFNSVEFAGVMTASVNHMTNILSQSPASSSSGSGGGSFDGGSAGGGSGGGGGDDW